MWVRFLRNFDFPAKSNVVIAYKAGHELRVPRACAEQALAAGAAVAVDVRPVRPVRPVRSRRRAEP